MKFTSNTKPLQDVLDLVVVQGNISKFYAKSTILQLSADSKGQLKLNTEADCVISQATLKGNVDKIEDKVLFVDAVLFKQLISTLDSATVSLDFGEDLITVYAGKSKFTVPNLLSAADMALQTPSEPGGEQCELKQELWKAVKNKQMYALSDNFVKLVYTFVYNGTKEIIVGDYTNSLFTRTMKVGLPSQCLLPATIVSVILGVDDKAKIYHIDRSFVLVSNTDAYEFVAELKPKYETAPEIGSYNADAIDELFTAAGADGLTVPAARIKNLLSQTSLLSEGDSPTIKITASGSNLKLMSDNVDGDVEGKPIGNPVSFEIEFKLKSIINIISNLTGETIGIYPSMDEDGSASACIFKDEDVSVILAGIDK